MACELGVLTVMTGTVSQNILISVKSLVREVTTVLRFFPSFICGLLQFGKAHIRTKDLTDVRNRRLRISANNKCGTQSLTVFWQCAYLTSEKNSPPNPTSSLPYSFPEIYRALYSMNPSL